MTARDEGATTVLVVDDDEDIRLILAQILSLQGYDAPTAANGLDALSQLYDGVRPCLILLDLMMPAMSGWEFRTKQLQDPKLADIPVVVLSGGDNVAQHASALKAAAYLEKPVDLDQLLAVVRTYCHKGNAPRES